MSVSINVDKVTKKFGNDTIIDKLSLEVKPGEFFTLLGPSGCGKTTLLRMIIGFNSIDGGEIRINDKVINNIPTNNRNMGMVFQNYAIFPHMSVKENVAFGLKNRKVPKDQINTLVDDILKVVKIDHLKDRMPVKLSGGQQQRVALARALVISPEVLLMDEPLSNLDAKLRVEMRNAIKRIHEKIGVTTIYVTHDQEEALAISDKIAVMNGGVIQQIGTPKYIYQRPVNVFVSTFIGVSNIVEAKVRCSSSEEKCLVFSNGYSEQIDNLEASILDNEPVLVSVRPEEFTFCDNKEGIKGTIKSSVFLGLVTNYFVETENGQELEVIQFSEMQDIIPNGTEVFLKVNANKINVFHKEGRHTLIKGVKRIE